MKAVLLLLVFSLCGCAPQEKVSARAVEVSAPESAAADRGKALVVKYGCVTCHDMAGAGTQKMGPSLAHIGSQPVIAKKLSNTAETLAKYLQDPQAADPDNTMPNLAIGPAESRDLAAYLMTLK